MAVNVHRRINFALHQEAMKSAGITDIAIVAIVGVILQQPMAYFIVELSVNRQRVLVVAVFAFFTILALMQLWKLHKIPNNCVRQTPVSIKLKEWILLIQDTNITVSLELPKKEQLVSFLTFIILTRIIP